MTSVLSRTPRQATSDTLPVLIEGGGAAGITAGLDLAAAGRRVHLIERSGHLGGQMLNLDKIYPTDHCAFCPLWTDIRRLQTDPRITVHLSSRIESLDTTGEGSLATIRTEPPHCARALHRLRRLLRCLRPGGRQTARRTCLSALLPDRQGSLQPLRKLRRDLPQRGDRSCPGRGKRDPEGRTGHPSGRLYRSRPQTAA